MPHLPTFINLVQKTYDAALEIVKHMSTIVDLLYEKAARMQTVS